MMPRPFLIALVGLLAPLAANAASKAPQQYVKHELPPGYRYQQVEIDGRTYTRAHDALGKIRVYGTRYVVENNTAAAQYMTPKTEFPGGQGSRSVLVARRVYDGKTGELTERAYTVPQKSGSVLDRSPSTAHPGMERVLYQDAAGTYHLMVHQLGGSVVKEHREISHAEFMRLKYPNFR